MGVQKLVDFILALTIVFGASRDADFKHLLCSSRHTSLQKHLFLVSGTEGFFCQTLSSFVQELIERIILAGFKDEEFVFWRAREVLVTAHDNFNFYEARITGQKHLLSFEWQKSNRHIKVVLRQADAFLSHRCFILLNGEVLNRNVVKGNHVYDGSNSYIEQEYAEHGGNDCSGDRVHLLLTLKIQTCRLTGKAVEATKLLHYLHDIVDGYTLFVCFNYDCGNDLMK